MIKLDLTNMTRAIAKAKQIRPRVTVVDAGARIYSVSGMSGRYTVKFPVADGHKLAECNCKAGQSNMVCYHVAAAAAVNMGIQGMRLQASTPAAAPAPAPLPPRIVRRIKRDHKGRQVVAVYCDGWAI